MIRDPSQPRRSGIQAPKIADQLAVEVNERGERRQRALADIFVRDVQQKVSRAFRIAVVVT
jgi:hypothetical protein